LRAPKERKTNIKKVKEHAIQREIASSLVFATSAILETNEYNRGGFDRIRECINKTILGEKYYRIKLLMNLKIS